MPLLFDSHLDLAWNALHYNRDLTEMVEQINQREAAMDQTNGGWGRAVCSLPQMRIGRMAVCQGVLFARANRHVQPAAGHRRIDLDWGTQSMVYAETQGQLAYYRLLHEQGEMRLIGTVSELNDHWSNWERAIAEEQPLDDLPIGNIVAMECADPIVEPRQAEVWFNDGLRTVMLAHYGQSHYAVGTGENGPLTQKGIELLNECERLGIILDMTHLGEQSFYEAYDRFNGPLMASHNNCRSLVPGDRQFNDEQIKMLNQREAVIGVACDAWMLKPGWIVGKSTPEGLTFSALVDQIDHICQLAGNALHVGIGSDLDGGYGTEQTPSDLKRISDLQNLEPILSARGYSAADIDKIFHANWLRFFRRWLPQ